METIAFTGNPNVWAWSWWADPARNDVQYTVYRSVKKSTPPRMAMTNFNNMPPVHVDTGTFDAPERFGSWATFEEFKTYVENFVRDTPYS